MSKGKVSFKAYTMAQASLIPPSWEELIPAEHLVRGVNQVIEQIEMKPLVEQYMGGGTSSYHPRMMLKVIVYPYAARIYSSRKIANALQENVNFMWLSGGNHFGTINGFRSGRLKETVRAVFTEVLELLLEGEYVRMENFFVDGTKIGANANAHKVVWARKTRMYKQRLQKQIAKRGGGSGVRRSGPGRDGREREPESGASGKEGGAIEPTLEAGEAHRVSDIAESDQETGKGRPGTPEEI